jgi:hypothetical protein
VCCIYTKSTLTDLRSRCAPLLSSLLQEDDVDLDAITGELHNIQLLLPEKLVGNVIQTQGKDGSGGPKEPRKCHYCAMSGHLIKHCRKRKRDEKAAEGGRSNKEDEVEGPAGELCMTEKAAIMLATSGKNDCLYFDSGATHHVVHSKDLLRDICKPSVSTVVLGGGEEHCVKCEGTVVLTGGPAGPVHLTRVLLVPTLAVHLCSGNKVTSKGATCMQRGDEVTISDSTDRVLLPGRKECGMYKLDCCLMPMEAHEPQAYANATTQLDLWHRRFAHVNKEDVQRLI